MNSTENAVNRYLDGLGATLWGRSFNINTDRSEAVQFIMELWRALENAEVKILAEFFAGTDLDEIKQLLGQDDAA